MDGCSPWGPATGGHGGGRTGHGGAAFTQKQRMESSSWINQLALGPGRNGTYPPATAMPHHHNLQLPSACTAALPAAILWDVLARGQEQTEPGWGELLTNNSSVSQRGAEGLMGPIPSCTNPTIDIASGAWLCSACMRTTWCCWGHRKQIHAMGKIYAAA